MSIGDESRKKEEAIPRSELATILIEIHYAMTQWFE
jgi:hypothetical protein